MSYRSPSPYLGAISFVLGLYCGYFITKSDLLEENTIKTCFTPGQDCTRMIVDAIDQAQKEILLQAYSFTSTPIVDALVRAANRGVTVRALLDKSNKEKKYPAMEALRDHPKIELKIDIVPGIAHNKVMVIDEKVITGSFNFTKAAQFRNAENVLIISNTNIAQKYRANWANRHKKSFKINDVATNASESNPYHTRHISESVNVNKFRKAAKSFKATTTSRGKATA